ncbi:hypothetical protein AM412_002386 [Acinetobacter baumannii]|nr:hypothetical protein AM412_002386 [Acinetobacter baumannii]OKO39077.1 hypothetical protein AM416_002384 [Acinetobacter baumannii]SLM57231.1 Uncharacterised protein [Acinetobacter baumannii]SMB68187.1 Uncharacterised protein [Acinetobacter baumannii]SMD56110.1 Uncharacterised protein [Acinetobacter baumannii]
MTIILYFLNYFIKPTYIQPLLLKQSFLRVLSHPLFKRTSYYRVRKIFT